MRRNITAAAAGIALIVALTGCSGAASSPAEPSTDPAASAAPAPSPTVDEEREATRQSLTFGEVYTYTDGTSVSVSEPAPFVPGQYAAGATQATNLVFNVVVTNGSEEVLEPIISPTLSSGGVEGSAIFDSEQNINGGPTTPILAGQSITFPYAFSITDPASLTFSISPNFNFENAIYTNVAP